MARLGFVGRIMLIVLCALSAVFLLTLGLEYWQRSRDVDGPARAPLLDQVAAIVAWLDRVPENERSFVLRAVNSSSLRVGLEPMAPQAPPGRIVRAPRIENLLQSYLSGEPPHDVIAYLASKPDGDNLGEARDQRLLRITTRLRTGHFVVIDIAGRRGDLSRRVLGLPPGFWMGIVGFAVAALALLAAVREAQPLRRLARSVARFDGLPQAPIPEKGAPDIRRLIQAVNGMQERIALLLRERSILIGSISHDLKTLLTRLRLRAEGIDDEPQRQRTVRDLDDMKALIDASLAFARGTTVSSKRQRVDLLDLVAVEVAEHAARGAAIWLIEEETNPAVVDADPVALRRVLTNVIGNAVLYGTRVEVAVKHSAGACRVTVDDDGPGIPESERSAVFSPFYRLETSRSRATGGSGLGLAIAKQIVDAHQGTIETSTSPLGGARLIIELPAVEMSTVRLTARSSRNDR